MTKTYMPTWEEAKANRTWVLIDAKNQILGRLASDIANKLRGKDDPKFTPHVDGGKFVVVINAKEIRLTGNKLSDKMYHTHSGYMGGIKSTPASVVLEKAPTKLIMNAVWGMLPKNRLSRQLITKLKVYADGNHPHEAQLKNEG